MKVLSSLTNRIFLASAALTVVCMGIAIYLVNVRVTESAEDELRRTLVQTGMVVEQQRATMSDLFTMQARLVADLPKLKAAVATDDPPTVTGIAPDYQRQIHSDLFLVTDRGGRVLAAIAQGISDERGLGSLPTIHEALSGREGATFWLEPDGVLEVVTVPITADSAPPEILGTLSVGFMLDDALAVRLGRLSGSEIAFAAAGRVRASTLPGPGRSALLAVIGKPGVSSVWVGGNEYLALVSPLAPPRTASLLGRETRRGEARVGDPATPAAIVLRSRTDRLRFLRPIQTALGVTGLVAVLLATGISYGIARTVTRPLATITATMKDIAATGDLTRKITWRARRWEDEDARLLARTFNTLTDSIAQFQREAAARERLSALGRLSTVIAHEVRNPLMIIKASLRPLAGGTVSPDELHEAVADIDEEVGRLNRLVNEVLDFARPIQFDFAPTDVNRLCQNAATAAAAGRAGPSAGLALDPSNPTLVTDAERLRSVLVNLLVNARQAVDSRAGAGKASGEARLARGGTDSADVVLSTKSLPDGRVALTVRDQGVGIAPSDLPRVFEPYFTTKRTGSGLGLAISRNIVQGLGGTIAITSHPGSGTEIRIELGSRQERQEDGALR